MTNPLETPDASSDIISGELGLATPQASSSAASPLVSVLWIAGRDADSDATRPVVEKLRARGHTVSEVAPDNWQPALFDVPPSSPAIEVILLDASGDPAQAHRLCAQIKAEIAAADAPDVPLVIVAQREGNASEDGENSWAWWQNAGCDALISGAVGRGELESQLALWARHAQLLREVKTMRDTLSKQVQIDDLTQVLNRRFFFQAAHREVSRARRYGHQLACLMVDINHFRLFNQTFGYPCGDEILRQVAGIIRSWTRDSDIVARFGAKKFVILLPETDVSGAVMLHEKLQRALDAHVFEWKHAALPVSISVGEAQRQSENETEGWRRQNESSRGQSGVEEEIIPRSVREELADLLEDADAALFVAKKGVRQPRLEIVLTPQTDTPLTGILGVAEN